jgi:putative PEP-CTERM system TPR-repeat lipoprotein
MVAALVACGSGGPSDIELIAAAQGLLAKKDLKGAAIQLKNALQKSPNSGQARFLLGKTLLESGDPVASKIELLKAQELHVPDDELVPVLAQAMLQTGDESKLMTQYGSTVLRDAGANADLKTSLAVASAFKGDIARAQQSVDEALRIKPGYVPALIMQSRLLAHKSNVDGAITTVDSALAIEPGNETAGVLKSDFLLRGKRNADSAIDSLRKSLVANPDSVILRSALANVFYQSREFAKAKFELATLLKAAPDHPETIFVKAQLAFNDGDLASTRELTEQLLKAQPYNARVLELAGASALRERKHLAAEALLSRAIKLEPTLRSPRLLLAENFLRSGQASKTLDALRPMLESNEADAASLVLAGEAYLQIGDIKKSEAAFKAALKAAPSNPGIRTSAAIAQIAAGDVSSGALAELEAATNGDSGTRADLALISMRLGQKDIVGTLNAIDAVEKKMPDDPLAFLLRGRVLLLKKDLAGAAKNFETALSKNAAFFPAVVSLAAIELAGGKPEAARQRFEAHLRAYPNAIQAQIALAELEASTGAPAATVIAALKKATKIDPLEPAAHLMLINRFLDQGDGKGALQAADEARAALPNHPEIIDALGRAQAAAGDAQSATTTLKKLTSAQPRNATFQLHLANAYAAIKDPDNAALALRKALEIQPDLEPALRAQALLAVQANRPKDALAIARGMQERRPNDGAGFLLEGEIEAARRNWEVSITALGAALQRNRTTASAISLHTVLRAAGKAAEAERLGTAWLKDNPKDAVFIFYLGDVALAHNNFSAAEASYRAVMDLQPNNAMALNNVAWLLAHADKPGGVALAERANSLLPDRVPILDTLSMALEVERQLPKAIETQLRVVKLGGGDPALSMRLAKLYIKAGDKSRARDELEALATLGDKFTGRAEVASLLKAL